MRLALGIIGVVLVIVLGQFFAWAVYLLALPVLYYVGLALFWAFWWTLEEFYRDFVDWLKERKSKSKA